MPGDTFELVLEPCSGSFDAADGRWLAQVSALYRDLESEIGGLRREATPVEGSKGGTVAVILALGSAGAFTAAVEFFKAWTARGRDRSLRMTFRDAQGEEQVITLEGTGISEESMRLVLAAGAARMGGGAWQAPVITPS